MNDEQFQPSMRAMKTWLEELVHEPDRWQISVDRGDPMRDEDWALDHVKVVLLRLSSLRDVRPGQMFTASTMFSPWFIEDMMMSHRLGNVLKEVVDTFERQKEDALRASTAT